MRVLGTSVPPPWRRCSNGRSTVAKDAGGGLTSAARVRATLVLMAQMCVRAAA